MIRIRQRSMAYWTPEDTIPGDVRSGILTRGGGMSTTGHGHFGATAPGYTKPGLPGSNQLPPRFDRQGDFCHAGEGQASQYVGLAMPLALNDKVVVHVVDDDPALRSALEGLFETVGLATRSYGAARDFLNSG